MTAGAAPPPELTLSFDYQSPFASLQRPQYRLRVEDIRIFYDVEELVFRPFFPTFRRELRLTLGQIELAGAAFRDAIALALTMRAKSFDLRATRAKIPPSTAVPNSPSTSSRSPRTLVSASTKIRSRSG